MITDNIAINELRCAAITSRTCYYERIIRDFINRYPDGTIVNLGCAPGNMYEQVQNRSVHWYVLDSAGTMEMRKAFFSDAPGEKYIICQFLLCSWFREINPGDHILFIANMPFYSIDEQNMKRFIKKLCKKFPLSELVFDVFSHTGAKFAARLLGEIRGDSAVKWVLKNDKEILLWDKRLRIIGKKVFFRQNLSALKLRNRIHAMISGALSMWYVLHVRILPDYRHLKVC